MNILRWALQFINKISKFNNKKFSFSFIFNSFSIALKKDIENKDYMIQDMMIFSGIYHYNDNELIEFLSENEKYELLYKQYKEIIKYCKEFKIIISASNYLKMVYSIKNYYIFLLVLF